MNAKYPPLSQIRHDQHAKKTGKTSKRVRVIVSVFFISFACLHVRYTPMGRTCRQANEIQLAATHSLLGGVGTTPSSASSPQPCVPYAPCAPCSLPPSRPHRNRAPLAHCRPAALPSLPPCLLASPPPLAPLPSGPWPSGSAPHGPMALGPDSARFFLRCTAH